MTKLLILGITGNLGIALEKELANEKKLQVLAPTRAILDLGSINQLSGFLEIHQPDVVINAAAWTNVEGAQSHEVEALHLNSVLPLELAKWCETSGSRLIHISTDYVFDGEKKNPYLERDSPNPKSIYGFSKHKGEIGVLKTAPTHSVIIRTSGLYGYTKNNFVLKIAKNALRKSVSKVVTDQIMAPTNSESLARFVLSTLELNNPPQLLHFSNFGSVSWNDVAQQIYRFFDVSSTLVESISSSQLRSNVVRPKQSKLGTEFPELSDRFNLGWDEGINNFLEGLVRNNEHLLY